MYHLNLLYKLNNRSRWEPKSTLLIIIPLVLSALTHIWNPLGFPTVQTDEGTYMGRAMMVVKGLGLHEAITTAKHDSIDVFTRPYDHPLFGQIFLAGALGVIGYPDVLSLEVGNVWSIELLYLAPRILMGLLAVADTFLIYKIAEKRYSNNKTIAFIAAVVFAVMPATWLLRRIWLDSIQLPLLLSSILFAIYLSSTNIKYSSDNNKKFLLMSISGIFLGLAIFTKIPAFTFIPLVGYLVLTSHRSLKSLGIWFIPVIGIPLLWPAYAVSIGEVDEWWEGFVWQATSRVDRPLWMAFEILFKMDPVLIVLGTIGIVLAAIRKDLFLLLWVAPLIVLLQVLGYVSYWFFIPILPALAVGSSWLIEKVRLFVHDTKKQKILLFSIIASLGVFGFISTMILIITDLTSTYYQVVASIVRLLHPSEASITDERVTLIGNRWVPSFSWIANFVFPTDLDYIKYYTNVSHIGTDSVLFVIDRGFVKSLEEEEISKELKSAYVYTSTAEILKDETKNFDRRQYPYTSMRENRNIGDIELRSNLPPN
jgi:hypothetical protein